MDMLYFIFIILIKHTGAFVNQHVRVVPEAGVFITDGGCVEIDGLLQVVIVVPPFQNHFKRIFVARRILDLYDLKGIATEKSFVDTEIVRRVVFIQKTVHNGDFLPVGFHIKIGFASRKENNQCKESQQE